MNTGELQVLNRVPCTIPMNEFVNKLLLKEKDNSIESEISNSVNWCTMHVNVFQSILFGNALIMLYWDCVSRFPYVSWELFSSCIEV